MKYKIIQISCMLITCSFCFIAHAQELVTRTNHNNRWKETYQVLKSDKKVKQGTYELSFDGKPLVTGSFSDGRPSAQWMRKADNGGLVLQYNFSSNKSEFYEREPEIKYELLAPVNEGDKVTLPASLVPLGYLFGKTYLDLLVELRGASGEYLTKLVVEIDDKNKPTFISCGLNKSGKLLIQKKITVDNDMQWAFVSASLNGQAVPSRLIYETKMTGTVRTTTEAGQRPNFPRN